RRAGPDAPQRTGCRLAAGYGAITLFWMQANGVLSSSGRACFLMDYFGAQLTGTTPVTDPTAAASAGVYDVKGGRWDAALIAALGLRPTLFPEVQASGSPLGTITTAMADATGLPKGLPV